MKISATFSTHEGAIRALTRMRQEGVSFSIVGIGDSVEMIVRNEQLDQARGILRTSNAADIRVSV